LATRIPTRLTSAQGRKFGLTLGIAFLVLAAFFRWRTFDAASYVAAAIGTLMLLGGLVVPTWLGPIERAWMGLAHAISRVTTPLIMGIVYFLVVTPIGLIMRAVGRNPLRPPASRDSVWATRSEDRSGRGGMEHQF
jgi:ABC-type uncharacterized transport system permease subunit